MKVNKFLFVTILLNGMVLSGCGCKSETPHEHLWSEPTYTWTDDFSSCTAKRVCSLDKTHVEIETKNSTYTVTVTATDTVDGAGTYTVTFSNSAFETQTQDVVLPKDVNARRPYLSADGKTIKYGIYPQTNVTDSNLISALNGLTTPESNGWYFYENCYYAKTNASPNESNSVFSNESTIIDGEIYWFKCEPVLWDVLNNDNGLYYIVSKVLLDVHCFYNLTENRTIDGKNVFANNYKYSDVRAWLNNEFYNSTFALGNNYINATDVDNFASDTYGCDNTNDKVFLPSFFDYMNASYGFVESWDDSDTRCCRITDWSLAKGASVISQTGANANNGIYWARSAELAGFSTVADVVDYSGAANGALNVTNQNTCVRPAIKINLV